MLEIAWQQFNSAGFQRFCNTLLWLEMGDDFAGFDASGKDGGIDGFLKGSYKRKKGPWRFQYKFHTTARREAVRTIKQELKIELGKLKNERQFVILTNVSFLPQERTELEAIAQNYFLQSNCTTISFRLWDGSVLNRLYLKHPLLKLWMEEGYSTSTLVPYKIKFDRQLAASPVAIDTLTNFFVSREEQLAELQAFLSNSLQHAAIIKGEAGIGKTRLVIEFFEKINAEKEKWLLLCVSYAFEIDKLRFALGNGKNYLLLVDDAQNFSSQQLNSLYHLAGSGNGGSIKIIFTVRNLSLVESFRLVKPFERKHMLNISLNKLSKEDAKKVFEAHLTNDYLRQFIDQLVMISRGRPILIVGILNAAEKRENISKIKTEDGFRDYVLDYFNTFLLQIAEETGIDRIKAKQVLGSICLLEPFPYDSPQMVAKIAGSEAISEDIVRHFLGQLRKLNFSSGTYQHSIKPDYYSDIFLDSVIDSPWLEKKLSQYPDYQANILTNLSGLDEVERETDASVQSHLSDRYLREYINEMENVGSSEGFMERLRVVLSIAFQKPGLAERAVELFIAAIQNSEHCFFKDYWENRSYESLRHNSEFSKVKSILTELLYRKESYDFVIDAVLQLYGLMKDKDLVTLFSYQHPVYLYQSSIQIQTFFVRRAAELLPEQELGKILFLIQGLNEVLKLSFIAAKWSVLNRDSFRITTHFLPKAPVIEKHRLNALAVLKSYYRGYANEDIKREALKAILDVPREISYTRRNDGSYKSDKETQFILQFLEEEAADCSIACQKEIRDELYWYRKQRVDQKFHSWIDRIENLLTPQNLTGRFVHLFSALETKIEDRGSKTKESINDLLSQSSAGQIATALSELYHSKGEYFYLFGQTIQEFTSNHVDKTYHAYLHLKAKDPRFILDYGSHFLRAFRGHEGYEAFFWSEIDFWVNENTVEAKNLLLHIYTIYSALSLSLTAADSRLIEKLCLEEYPELEYNIAHALPVLYHINQEKSEESFAHFLARCKSVNAEHVFRLFVDQFGTSAFLVNLFLKYSIPHELNHRMEYCLVKVAGLLSDDKLFSYFEQRFEYQLKLEGDKQFLYHFVPGGDHLYFRDHLTDERKYHLFELALRWFIGLEGNWKVHHFANRLIEYLMPSHDIDKSLTSVYRQVYEDYKKKSQSILRLADTLANFHNKSKELFELLNFWINDAMVAHGTSEQFVRQLKSSLKECITAAGIKSGTPGQPFAFDVRLRQLLNEALPIYQENRIMKEILTSALRHTEATIVSDTERDAEDEW